MAKRKVRREAGKHSTCFIRLAEERLLAWQKEHRLQEKIPKSPAGQVEFPQITTSPEVTAMGLVNMQRFWGILEKSQKLKERRMGTERKEG